MGSRLFVVFVVLRFELRGSSSLGSHCTTRATPQTLLVVSLVIFQIRAHVLPKADLRECSPTYASYIARITGMHATSA
jgi:hypothetical protein